MSSIEREGGLKDLHFIAKNHALFVDLLQNIFYNECKYKKEEWCLELPLNSNFLFFLLSEFFILSPSLEEKKNMKSY